MDGSSSCGTGGNFRLRRRCPPSRLLMPRRPPPLAIFAGALGGILIPMVLERVRADPAVASGTFVTTITDVVGFFSFLGIATLWFGLK